MLTFLTILYCTLAGVALINGLLIRRPGTKTAPGVTIHALIPARNEEENLAVLLPLLAKEVDRITVYSDHSTDRTAEIARENGATVIESDQDPPEGWTGKNNACHQLALSVAEGASETEWWVFLDADTRPKEGFGQAMRSLIAEVGATKPVISGFTRMIPGRGLEPVYMSWVPWILLATCPFGLICRSGCSHPRFTNGQFVMWQSLAYLRILPNEAVKGKVLEDVAIGRHLAREKVPVEVVDISGFLGVQMYRTLEEAHQGMKKNSAEITGNLYGSLALAAFLLLTSFGWLLFEGRDGFVLVFAFFFSRLLTGFFAGQPLWTIPLFPLALVMAAHTVLESAFARRFGQAVWKGRAVGEKV